MPRKLIFITIIVAIFIIASVALTIQYFFGVPVQKEVLGGKYNATILIKSVYLDFDVGEILYTVEGVEHRGFYGAYFRDALEWIKVHTAENASFLNWWDYGHMIFGYGERDTIIKNPSQEALDSVVNPDDFRNLEPHVKLVEVASALTTTEVNLTKSIMDTYDATYIILSTEDGGFKTVPIFTYSGLTVEDYVQPPPYPDTFKSGDYTSLGKDTILYKLLDNNEVEGLTQVYSDEIVKIFKIT